MEQTKQMVSFDTADGVRIVADWYPVPQASGYALLLHMMPSDRKSWEPFVPALRQAGIAALAIDLRGHGESTLQAGKTLDYHAFSDTAHQASSRDVEAAMQWMKEQGAREETTAIIGASIGANLALVHAAAHQATPVVIALSPGLDYHGIKTEPAISALGAHQAVYLAAAKGDVYSFESVQRLHELSRAVSKVWHYDTDAHGTNLSSDDAALPEKIARAVSGV